MSDADYRIDELESRISSVEERVAKTRVQVVDLDEMLHKRIDELKNDLATLAFRCGITHGTVKLGVERGKEGG